MIPRVGLLARRAKRYAKGWLVPPPAPDGRVRLNLGCGKDYRPGYVNVDESPAADCDVRFDFTRIGEAYEEGSVDEVHLIHSLGYLRLWQARDLLAKVLRILRPGGLLVIELPDLGKCARMVIESEADLPSYLEAVRAIHAFDLGMIERRERFAPYAFSWSAWHLKLELERIGFNDVRIGDPQTHGKRSWRDVRVEAAKRDQGAESGRER